MIKLVAEELLVEITNRESVCRYGGEEFCIALLDMSIEKAAAVAERLRRSMAAERFAPIPISLSFGVAAHTDGASSLYELINLADQALYASKERGRNRVTRWDQMESAAKPEVQDDRRDGE